jgi:uncharacterized OB-fold protein
MKFGRVLSWTELHSPAEGFDAPVRLCLVRLNEGSVVIAMFEGEIASGDNAAVRVKGDKLVARRAAEDLAR